MDIPGLPGPKKQERPNFQIGKKTNKDQIFKENLPKYIKKFLEFHRMLRLLL
jgi:hypothetical protein